MILAVSIILKDYCLDLWNSSQKVKSEVSEIYQCKGFKEVKDYKCRISIQTDEIENTVKNGVSGQTISKNKYKLKSFFPFWKECPMKHRKASFSNIWFCYAHTVGAAETFEKEIMTIANNSDKDNW